MEGQEIWEGWGSVLLAVGTTLTFMLIVAVAVWQAFKTWQTAMASRALIARDEAFRELAEQSAQLQQDLVEGQRRLAEGVSELRAKVGKIEKLLMEVG